MHGVHTYISFERDAFQHLKICVAIFLTFRTWTGLIDTAGHLKTLRDFHGGKQGADHCGAARWPSLQRSKGRRYADAPGEGTAYPSISHIMVVANRLRRIFVHVLVCVSDLN